MLTEEEKTVVEKLSPVQAYYKGWLAGREKEAELIEKLTSQQRALRKIGKEIR